MAGPMPMPPMNLHGGHASAESDYYGTSTQSAKVGGLTIVRSDPVQTVALVGALVFVLWLAFRRKKGGR